MLPKINRLPLRTDFSRLKKQGKIIHGNYFSLLFVNQGENGQPPRFGFIVSKKVCPKAVDRNKARRLLQEGVGAYLDNIQLGTEGVFLTKKTIKGASLVQLKTETQKIIQQAHLSK